MKRARSSVIKRLMYFGIAIISVFCVSFIAISMRYHRVALMCYYPRSFVKTHVLGNASSKTEKSTLLKHYCKYIGGYIGSQEFLAKQTVQAHHDTLLNYKINFFSYYDLQHLFHEIFTHEIYKFSTNTQEPFIIDCGSNIGISILYFKTLYPQAHIIGFEPDQKTFGILAKNIEQNNLANVQLVNKAVAGHDGEITFYSNPDQQGATRMNMFSKELGCRQATVVKATKLSHVINRPVDFLKMDIEGAETQVFQELADSGKLSFVKNMVLEYHHHMHDSKHDNLSVLLGILEKNGFGYQLHVDRDGDFKPGIAQFPLIYAYKK